MSRRVTFTWPVLPGSSQVMVNIHPSMLIAPVSSHRKLAENKLFCRRRLIYYLHRNFKTRVERYHSSEFGHG